MRLPLAHCTPHECQNGVHRCAVPTTISRKQTPGKLPGRIRLDSTLRPKMDASGFGRSQSAAISPSPPHATSKPFSPGMAPGLTLRFEYDMTSIKQSTQSAPPVRALRRLPPIPSQCNNMPTPSTALPKYFSDASVNSSPTLISPTLIPKRNRPLPCPPTLSKEHPRCFTATVVSPIARPPIRAVRSLPTPGQKVEPLLLNLNNAPPLKVPSPPLVRPLPLVPPLVVPAPSKILEKKNRLSEEKTKYDGITIEQENDLSKRHIILTVDDADDSGEDERADEDKENLFDDDPFLLQEPIVFAPRWSLDSDITTRYNGNFSLAPSLFDMALSPNMPTKSATFPGTPRNVHFSPTNSEIHTDLNEDEEEEGLYVDYAWVLSNSILYRQKVDQQHMAKWVREKKGKRYTEQDYENVLKALRTLRI